MKIEIPIQLDDCPISPEAFRVYFAIARSVAELQEFPSVRSITSRCFGKKYALGQTHTRLALVELIKWNLVCVENENYRLTSPEEWKIPGSER